MAEAITQARPSRRFVGKWLINWAWVAEIEDHGDGSCTIVQYDRTKTPVPFENGNIVESPDGKRTVTAVRFDRGGSDNGPVEIRVRNQKHVFSYKGEKS